MTPDPIAAPMQGIERTEGAADFGLAPASGDGLDMTLRPNPSKEPHRPMSDALIQSQQTRINELTQQLAEARSESARRRQQNKSLKEQIESINAEWQAKYDEATGQLEELAQGFEALDGEYQEKLTAKDTEISEWKTKAEAVPDELQSKLSEYEKAIALRDHKDTWRELTKDEDLGLNGELAPEAAWKLIDYSPEGKPDAAKLKEALIAAKENSPYKAALFAAPKAPETPATPAPPVRKPPGPGIARGAATVEPGKFVVPANADPKWTFDNRNAIAEAAKNGTLVYADQ